MRSMSWSRRSTTGTPTLAEVLRRPIGSTNALAKTVIGLFKTEVIRREGPYERPGKPGAIQPVLGCNPRMSRYLPILAASTPAMATWPSGRTR